MAALVRSGAAACHCLSQAGTRVTDCGHRLWRLFGSCNILTMANVDEKERGSYVLQGTISAAVPRAVDGRRVCCWPWQRNKAVSPCCFRDSVCRLWSNTESYRLGRAGLRSQYSVPRPDSGATQRRGRVFSCFPEWRAKPGRPYWQLEGYVVVGRCDARGAQGGVQAQ